MMHLYAHHVSSLIMAVWGGLGLVDSPKGFAEPLSNL